MKDLLLTPGPTTIPHRIFAAMNRGTMHHRTKEFEAEFKLALDNLKDLTGCAETPILLSASGTGAMEAVLLNTIPQGGKVIVLNAGVFGERWSLIAQKIGLQVVEIKAPAGRSPSLHQIEEVLLAHPDTGAFALQCTETSTTVNHPFAPIAALIRQRIPQCLVILDAVSALATMDISFLRSEIDAIVAGSQKGFMLPPGLAMLIMNKRAWDAAEKVTVRSFYFDLKTERKAHEKNTSAWTPAMNLILGLNEAFKMLREEGYSAVYERHERLARATRAALRALEFELLAPDFPAVGVTGAYPPSGIDAESLRAELLASHRVKITGGQASLQGKIIRIGHMGYVSHLDVLAAISALELSLSKLGLKSGGQGVRAAMEEFSR